MKYIVYHQGYGCETGCCGHVVYKVPDDYSAKNIWDDDQAEEVYDTFSFDHPFRMDEESQKNWAKIFLSKELGEEHAKDLDWEHSYVVDD